MPCFWQESWWFDARGNFCLKIEKWRIIKYNFKKIGANIKKWGKKAENMIVFMYRKTKSKFFLEKHCYVPYTWLDFIVIEKSSNFNVKTNTGKYRHLNIFFDFPSVNSMKDFVAKLDVFVNHKKSFIEIYHSL